MTMVVEEEELDDAKVEMKDLMQLEDAEIKKK